MPVPTPRPIPGTIGQLLVLGMDMTVFCNCGRSAQVDLARLVARLGHDRVYVGPALNFRCRACGGTTKTIRLCGKR